MRVLKRAARSGAPAPQLGPLCDLVASFRLVWEIHRPEIPGRSRRTGPYVLSSEAHDVWQVVHPAVTAPPIFGWAPERTCGHYYAEEMPSDPVWPSLDPSGAASFTQALTARFPYFQ
jgi:hypothetical protein